MSHLKWSVTWIDPSTTPDSTESARSKIDDIRSTNPGGEVLQLLVAILGSFKKILLKLYTPDKKLGLARWKSYSQVMKQSGSGVVMGYLQDLYSYN